MKLMKLYNTLTKTVEEVKPIKDGAISIYACGPTVYNHAHIGNLRAYLAEDFLRRAFEYSGFTVNHGMNVTDVGHMVGDGDEGEDKLEVGGRRENKHPLEIAREYEKYFFESLDRVSVEQPDKVIRATESVPAQIEIIKLLEEKGYTYKDEAAIYFDTTKLADYGKLTGQKLSDKMVGVREEVVVDEHKRNPQDFVLWFFLTGKYENHILHWPSPWGEGFPGWHIECSAISREILGQPFDLHLGGIDHIGVHHTNEIAQSEAAFGVPLANYWVHVDFLLVDGEKMSKSLGNVYRLEDIEQKGFAPLDLRYLVFSSHYQSVMNFTWRALEGAANARKKLLNFVRETKHLSYSDKQRFDPGIPKSNLLPEYKQKFVNALNDNLDTPTALAVVWEMVRDSTVSAEDRMATLLDFDKVLAFGLSNQASESIPPEIEKLAKLRQEARVGKDFSESDRIRAEIEGLGWQIEDKPDNDYRIFLK